MESEPDTIQRIKSSTKEQTFKLFKDGLSLTEIAQLRGFAISTFEGHLTPYVTSGEIDIDRIGFTKDKQKKLF